MPAADPIATFLRLTGDFKGKGRLLGYWLRTRRGARQATLPGGLRMSLDISTPYEAMIWMGWEESDDLEALARLLRPGDVFVDCGANLGLWSLVAAPLVAPSGAVHAFEPNPVTAERLRMHAEQSSLIQVHPTALAATRGTVSFDPGDHHNVSRVSDGGHLRIASSTLDDELSVAPSGIKIDVEGYELEVLRGARAALRSRPWIIIEFNKEHADSQRLEQWPVHKYLIDLGYAAYTLREAPLPDDWSPRHGYANVMYKAQSSPSRGRLAADDDGVARQ